MWYNQHKNYRIRFKYVYNLFGNDADVQYCLKRAFVDGQIKRYSKRLVQKTYVCTVATLQRKLVHGQYEAWANVASGIAVCSDNEKQFSKKEGRRIALTRLHAEVDKLGHISDEMLALVSITTRYLKQ